MPRPGHCCLAIGTCAHVTLAACWMNEAIRCSTARHPAGTGGISHARTSQVRLWDRRRPDLPLVFGELACGGGVWRLDWHPTCRTRLLAAAMHGGLCVADVRDASAPHKVAANYCEHGSIQHPQLVYGAGWYAGCTRGQDLEGDIGASVSFYDRSLHLWRLSRTLGAADEANSDGCPCAIVLLSLQIGAIPISSGTRIGTRGTENSDLPAIGIVSHWHSPSGSLSALPGSVGAVAPAGPPRVRLQPRARGQPGPAPSGYEQQQQCPSPRSPIVVRWEGRLRRAALWCFPIKRRAPHMTPLQRPLQSTAGYLPYSVLVVCTTSGKSILQWRIPSFEN